MTQLAVLQADQRSAELEKQNKKGGFNIMTLILIVMVIGIVVAAVMLLKNADMFKAMTGTP